MTNLYALTFENKLGETMYAKRHWAKKDCVSQFGTDDPSEIVLFASYTEALHCAQRSGVEWQVVAIVAQQVA
jgi:hypothetical protein